MSLETEVILVTKVGNVYTAVYQNEKEEMKHENEITAQQIFDYAKNKFSKKNDI